MTATQKSTEDHVTTLKTISRELSCITAQLGRMMAPISAMNGENLAKEPVRKVMEAGTSLLLELQRVESLAGNLHAVLTGAVMGLKQTQGNEGLEGLLVALKAAAEGHDCWDPNCHAHDALRGWGSNDGPTD